MVVAVLSEQQQPPQRGSENSSVHAKHRDLGSIEKNMLELELILGQKSQIRFLPEIVYCKSLLRTTTKCSFLREIDMLLSSCFFSCSVAKRRSR